MQFRFGDHVLDSGTRELRRAGEPVHLSPKGFELLLLLLEGRPNALSKAELQERIWPGAYVVEANLPNLVAELRAALGDDARRPRFIRTVHRYGYAFVGAAEAQSTAPRPARWRLVWKGGEATLGDGRHLIGRDPGIAVTLDFPTVSRHHAALRVAGEEITAEDLGSKNGTTVNGRPVEGAVALAEGDELGLGSLRLRLRRAHAATTRTLGAGE